MKSYLSFLLFWFIAISVFSQSQPSQPENGPGGSNYPHNNTQMYTYGAGVEQFWIFEPSDPKPDSADVIAFIHGLADVNPKVYGTWINHLVKKGNIVIFPRYQIGDIGESDTSFNFYTGWAIKAAFDTLTNPNHVFPRLNHFAIAGHSYGGLLTANMGITNAQYNLPNPQCLFVAQPYNDAGNTVRIADYKIMPSDKKILIVVGQNDVIVGNTFGRFLMDSTINVSTEHKNYITLKTDNHGSPSIAADHSDPMGAFDEYDSGLTNTFIIASLYTAETDAADYFCFWKLFDALLSCTFYNQDCVYAFGDTPEQKNMGTWNDGTPVTPLMIEPTLSRIDENEKKSKLLLYPNPIIDRLFSYTSNTYIQINDLTGKTVYKGKMPENGIETRLWKSGLYFYEANLPNGMQTKGKLIIRN